MSTFLSRSASTKSTLTLTGDFSGTKKQKQRTGGENLSGRKATELIFEVDKGLESDIRIRNGKLAKNTTSLVIILCCFEVKGLGIGSLIEAMTCVW